MTTENRTNSTRDFGVTRAMSVPQFAQHIDLHPKSMDEIIREGLGPRVIKVSGKTKPVRRILACDGINVVAREGGGR